MIDRAALARFLARYKRPPADEAEWKVFQDQEQHGADSRARAPQPQTTRLGEIAAKLTMDGEPVRLRHRPIWDTDAENFKRDTPFIASAWQDEVDASIERYRKPKQPSAKCLGAVSAELLKRDYQRQGCVIRALRMFVLEMWYGRESVRRSIDWLEEHGHIYRQPTRTRDGKLIRNAANCYVLQMQGDLPPSFTSADVPADVPADAPSEEFIAVARHIAGEKRWSPCFGTVIRDHWLNIWPQRRRRYAQPA